MARVWDVTWAATLHGDALVRAVARTRLVGECWLTEDELPTLRPLLGEVDPDMVARWLEPLPDRAEEAEMEAALARWHRHREMIRTLARKDWAAGPPRPMLRWSKVVAARGRLASRSLSCCSLRSSAGLLSTSSRMASLSNSGA
jgi:hypothetical protein